MRNVIFLPLILVIGINVIAQKSTSTKSLTKTVTSVKHNITTQKTPNKGIEDFTEYTTTDPTCVINNTCSTEEDGNLTTIDANTTVAPEISTTKRPSTITLLREGEIYKFTNTKTCSCDLQDGYCDINCCCDKDCSFNDKLVFESCQKEKDRYYDTNFCQYSEYIYLNNTPYEWEVTQNGLFCIVRTNLPKEFLLQKKQTIISIEDAKLQMTNKYPWKSLEVGSTKKIFNTTEFLQYGQSVWVLRNGSDISQLKIPDSFITRACLGEKPIKYLQDAASSCTPTRLDGGNALLFAGTYFQNMSIIASPKLFNSSYLNTSGEGCPKNICIPIEVKFCDGYFEHCSNVTNQTSNLEPFCSTSNSRYESSCRHLTQKVKYVLYHNGSMGITKAEVHLVLRNYTYSLRDELGGFSQDFQLEFRWINHTYLNFSSRRSGNPGYIIGRPILVANLVVNETYLNDTTTNKTKVISEKYIVRNSTLLTDNFLVLPFEQSGLCILNQTFNEVMEFGYNTILKCTIKERVNILSKNFSSNETCRRIQKAIFNYWPISYKNTSEKLIGGYGNAKGNTINDWTEVLYDVPPQKLLNETYGQLSSGNTSLVCRGITTNLYITIFHSRTVYEDLLNQEKIIRATFSFGGPKTAEFPLLDNQITLEAPLRAEVMFVDITAKVVKKYADPPSFRIRLPYDFFYPFIKVSSNALSNFIVNFYVITLFAYTSLKL